MHIYVYIQVFYVYKHNPIAKDDLVKSYVILYFRL